MGFFNSGGLITRGFGEDHRIITRGMSIRFDVGGGPFKRRKEYEIDIFTSIAKENFLEMGVYGPLKIIKEKDKYIMSNISKKIEGNLNILTRVNHDKLFEILDKI